MTCLHQHPHREKPGSRMRRSTAPDDHFQQRPLGPERPHTHLRSPCRSPLAPSRGRYPGRGFLSEATASSRSTSSAAVGVDWKTGNSVSNQTIVVSGDGRAALSAGLPPRERHREPHPGLKNTAGYERLCCTIGGPPGRRRPAPGQGASRGNSTRDGDRRPAAPARLALTVERLARILDLERTGGCHDRAVIGGLDAFLETARGAER